MFGVISLFSFAAWRHLKAAQSWHCLFTKTNVKLKKMEREKREEAGKRMYEALESMKPGKRLSSTPGQASPGRQGRSTLGLQTTPHVQGASGKDHSDIIMLEC